MAESQRLKTDLLAVGLLAVAVFLGLSLLSYDPADPPALTVYPPRAETANICGPVGARCADLLMTCFGGGAYLVFVALLVLDIRLFARKIYPDPLVRAGGAVLLMTAVCIGLRLGMVSWTNSPAVGGGGYVGAWGFVLMRDHFSLAGTSVLVLSGLVAGLLLTTDTLLFRVLRWGMIGPFVLFQRVGFGKQPGVEPAAVAEPVDETAAAKSSTGKSKKGPKEPLRIRVTDAEATDKATGEKTAETSREEQLTTNILVPAASETLLVERDASLDQQEMENIAGELEDDDTLPEVAEVPMPRQPIRVNRPVTTAKKALHQAQQYDDIISQRSVELGLPSLDLLEEAEDFPYEYLAEKARIAAMTLERTFQEFGLNVRVVEIDTGPVITQFELELEAGLRLSKITSLADDLAIALRVPSVRVVAPIPGKNTVGVEVPNDKRVMVRLRELIESSGEATEKKRIPIFLGKDVSGRPLVVDMAKMPHLLIAGRTGTGKSVCLNTLILSILMTKSPDEVRMLMIDPKMVELSPYMRVPHLMHPVITDMKKAEAVLGWSVEKMEERYDLLARCGVRHIDSYNELGRAEIVRRLGIDPDSEEADQVPERMPYIVIVADEMADMMMTSGKDVEGHIIRLAQKSRAVGIHLVLATQKPTVDVITGLIKSNLPARISFQVASRVDSRVVLDEMGADKLLGNGDMLYLAPGTSRISRAQGTYVSDDEVNKVIDFFRDCEPQYSRELAQLNAKNAGQGGIEAIRARDELYEKAIDVVVREGRGSVSLLQRALGIGYGRGARLIDYMAEDGIVGDYNGSQARDVLYTPEQWAEIVAGHQLEEVS